MSCKRNLKTKAFGVELGWAPYRLRQARYYDLGLSVARWVDEQFEQTGERTDLLDIGTYYGTTRIYTDTHEASRHIDYHAVDIFPHGKEFVFKHEDWTMHEINLENGMPELESDRYDIVVCEQVLEHLHNPQQAFKEMYRVLKPGCHMILGIPCFPIGLDLIRKHVIPITDRLFRVKKVRGHVQAWSKWSFLRMLRKSCPDVQINQTRGFRIISGGILRPLEYLRWWWQLNRFIGRIVPSACIEIQVLVSKPLKEEPEVSDTTKVPSASRAA